MMRGRCVVVGGHSRGVGKTALVVELVRALAGSRVATVKVSARRHGRGAAGVQEDRVPSLLTPTGRCLAAGAERAFLCRCPDDALDLAITLVEHLTEGGSTVIVESNRLAPLVAADLTCFVVSDATRDWKASSSAIVPRADTIVLSPGTLALPVSAPVLAALPSRPRTFRFRADWTVPHLAPWVARRVGPVADAGPGLHARHVAQFAIGGSWLGPRQPT